MKKTNLILGSISVGKTRGVMFPEVKKMIENEENIVVVDNKQEYYKNHMRLLSNKGYNTYVVNLNDTKKSHGFNPLSLPYKLYKAGNKDIAIQMLKNIALVLTKNDAAMDSFWSTSASDYFTGLALLLFKLGKDEEINIGSIQMMVSQIELNQDKFKTYINGLDLISPEYILLSGTALSPIETRGGIVSTLKTEINKYIAAEDLLNLLCENELDLYNLKNKTAIFIIGSTNYNRITNILLDELILLDNLKFNYILDNIDSLSNIIELDKLLESNNKTYIISRNIEHLIDKYDKFITDKFENIINVKENDYEISEDTDFNEYPTIDAKNNCYFNIAEYLNKNN